MLDVFWFFSKQKTNWCLFQSLHFSVLYEWFLWLEGTAFHYTWIIVMSFCFSYVNIFYILPQYSNILLKSVFVCVFGGRRREEGATHLYLDFHFAGIEKRVKIIFISSLYESQFSLFYVAPQRKCLGGPDRRYNWTAWTRCLWVMTWRVLSKKDGCYLVPTPQESNPTVSTFHIFQFSIRSQKSVCSYFNFSFVNV